MISKRGLIVAGALGTGSVLFAAGSALACNINDFNVGATANCDISSGSPMAQISVTDTDSSGTASNVSIFVRNADGSNGAQVGTLDFAGHGSNTQQVSVPWVDSGVWNVVVNANRYMKTTTAAVHPSAGNATCAVQKPSPTNSATPTQPAQPIAATSAPAAPAPSQSSAGTVLAETGGGSDSGMIAGFAAALVVVGGGVLYTVRRRSAAARHN